MRERISKTAKKVSATKPRRGGKLASLKLKSRWIGSRSEDMGFGAKPLPPVVLDDEPIPENPPHFRSKAKTSSLLTPKNRVTLRSVGIPAACRRAFIALLVVALIIVASLAATMPPGARARVLFCGATSIIEALMQRDFDFVQDIAGCEAAQLI